MSLISVIFVLLNMLKHSTGKTLSFEVLSILPSNVGRQRLSGNAPLTVVFSLPVIQLGEQCAVLMTTVFFFFLAHPALLKYYYILFVVIREIIEINRHFVDGIFFCTSVYKPAFCVQ